MHLIKKVDHILFSGECKENTNIACGSKFFHNFELVGRSWLKGRNKNISKK